MNPTSDQPEHARRHHPTHGSSRAGLASSGLLSAYSFIGATVCSGYSVVCHGVRDVHGVVDVRAVTSAVIGTVLGILAGVIGIRDARKRSGRGRSANQQRSARPVLRIAAGLLRGEARAAWLEESEAWLLDLREAGEPWYRLLAEQLSMLTRLPWLVMIHWLSARRAVDR